MSDATSTSTRVMTSLPVSVPEHTRILLTLLSAALAFGFMALAASSFKDVALIHWPLADALNWTLAGTIALGVAIYLQRPALPKLDTAPIFAVVPIRWRTIGAGILLLALLAVVNGHALPGIPYTVQVALFVGGAALVVRGMAGGWSLPQLERRELVALVAITLFALVLRLWGLEDTVHRFVDEIPFANGVTRLWETPDTPILTPFNEVAAFTWLYPYLQSGTVSLFGATLTGLRVVSAVLGALTVPALYCLARLLFDRKTAIVAALILATFPPHLHFSRLALNNIADPLFGTLALAFAARGLKSNHRGDYALAGAALGLTQYFYEGGRLLFPPLVISWFIIVWLLGKRWRFDARPALAGLLVAFLVAAPLFYTAIARQFTLSPRLDNAGLRLETAYVSAQQRWETLPDPLLIYVSIPDRGWFYRGDHPLILYPLVAVFLLGIAFMAWRLRWPGAMLVLLWLLFTSLGNLLLVDRAWSPRYVVAFPALALLLAVGLRYMLDFLWPAPARPEHRVWLTGALALVLVAGQGAYYFGQHLYDFNHQYDEVKDPEDALYRSMNFPPGTQVHIFVEGAVWDLNIETLLKFWNLDITAEARFPAEIPRGYLRAIADSPHDHAFFIAPEDTETRERVAEFFRLLPAQYSPYNIPLENQLALYYAPSERQGRGR